VDIANRSNDRRTVKTCVQRLVFKICSDLVNNALCFLIEGLRFLRLVAGEGNIDLKDEKVNIVVLPAPKNFSPLSLRSYIRVNGHFKNISVFPDPIKTGTDSLFKKIFNVITMLVMTPLQPRDLGQGKDVDCDALIAQVQNQDPQGLVLRDVYEATGGEVPANRGAAEQTQKQKREKNNG